MKLRRPAGWRGDKLRTLWVLAFNERLRHENRILKERQESSRSARLSFLGASQKCMKTSKFIKGRKAFLLKQGTPVSEIFRKTGINQTT